MLSYDSILHHQCKCDHIFVLKQRCSIRFLLHVHFYMYIFTCTLLHFYMCTFTFYSNSNVSLLNTFIDIHYVIAINYKHKVIGTIQWIKSNEIVRSSYVMFDLLSEILFNRKLINFSIKINVM